MCAHTHTQVMVWHKPWWFSSSSGQNVGKVSFLPSEVVKEEIISWLQEQIEICTRPSFSSLCRDKATITISTLLSYPFYYLTHTHTHTHTYTHTLTLSCMFINATFISMFSSLCYWLRGWLETASQVFIKFIFVFKPPPPPLSVVFYTNRAIYPY